MLGLAAGLGLGLNALGQALNFGENRRSQRLQQQYNREMLDYQNQQNTKFWQMQNEYNSPQSQMQRLKDAGLNPNLVYGATAPGNSSGQIHSATPQSFSPEPARFSPSSALQDYFNIATQSAQLDNLRAMNKKIIADAKASLATAGIKSSELDYSSEYYGSRARKLTIDRERSGLSRDLQFALQTPDNELLSNNPNIRDTPAYRKVELQVKNAGIDTLIKNNINNGKSLDNTLKRLEVQLRKNGLSSKDPIVARIIGQLIGQFFSLQNFK